MERRIISVELRASQSGKQLGIGGYAARYNVRSNMLNANDFKFKERIRSGAFDSVLAGQPDVIATYNHNQSVILGRTTSGTLQLRSDANGLRFDCNLPDTQAARDVHTLVQRGDLNSCSFAFLGTDETWTEEDDDEDNGTRGSNRIAVRNITNFHKLVDCSVVSSPAYPGTSVDARNIVAAEVRSKAKNIVKVPSDYELLRDQLREVTYFENKIAELQAPARVIARRKNLLNQV
jgi:HK97 family phage prohead protease